MAALPTEETLRFLERHLPPPPARVLEVGCGDGAVALALAARGYALTGLDEALEVPPGAGADRVRWVEADFLYHEEQEPYDAVLFTRSLHHMAPASRGLDRALALLTPRGALIAEEFAFDRVNVHTARWLYDLEAVLMAAEVLSAPEARFAEERRALLRWRQEHASDPPLQSGHEMLVAARERFELTAVEEAPYLYRYLAERLESTPRGERVLRAIFDLESRLVRERDIAAAGLRMVGRPLG
jgi:SAM-dependent methyltransferase